MTYEETYGYDNDEAATETLGSTTIKLLDAVCEGVEVPDDDEVNEAMSAHHDSHPPKRHPNAWQA